MKWAATGLRISHAVIPVVNDVLGSSFDVYCRNVSLYFDPCELLLQLHISYRDSDVLNIRHTGKGVGVQCI